MIITSAPNKVYIAGEHFVVYGARALLSSVEVNEKRNRIAFKEKKDEQGISFIGDLGTANFFNGRKRGAEVYFPILDGIGKFLDGRKTGVSIELEWSGAPKGTGNSASIITATVLGASAFSGENVSEKELFDISVEIENAYHGGKASGGDVASVLSSSPIIFKKCFPSYTISPMYTKQFLFSLIDTFSGERETTGELIEKFAKAMRITKKPEEMSDEQRERLCEEYEPLCDEIMKAMRDGDVERLGRLMNENHRMLKERNVSSPEIEKAMSIANSSGAYGGKLVGAGGKGGAALVLCDEKNRKKVEDALTTHGFFVFSLNLPAEKTRIDYVGGGSILGSE